jgi:hypothetical protein
MSSLVAAVVGTEAALALGGATIGAVGSYLGASSQADAAESAAQSSKDASMYATDLQRQMYEENVARQQPWLQAGENALAQLTAGTAAGGQYMQPFGMEQFQADPGYDFRMSEGVNALDRSAASRGMLLSGAQLKGVQEYGQNLGSQEYKNAYDRYNTDIGNQYNRLASLAGVGQTATGALQQAGSQYSSNVGNLAMQNAATQGNAALATGQANASMYQGIGNTLGRAVQSYWGAPTSSTIAPASSYNAMSTAPTWGSL